MYIVIVIENDGNCSVHEKTSDSHTGHWHWELLRTIYRLSGCSLPALCYAPLDWSCNCSACMQSPNCSAWMTGPECINGAWQKWLWHVCMCDEDCMTEVKLMHAYISCNLPPDWGQTSHYHFIWGFHDV